MGCRPVDSAAAVTHRESIIARVHERKQSLPHRFAAYILQLRVALRASREGGAARIDRELLKHFTELFANRI